MKPHTISGLCIACIISFLWIYTASAQTDIGVSEADATLSLGLGPSSSLATSLQQVVQRVFGDYSNATIVQTLVDAPAAMRTALANVAPRVSPDYASASLGAPLLYPKALVNDQVAPQLVGTVGKNLGSTANSVLLTWEVNEFAKSTLDYGTAPGSYSQTIVIDSYQTSTRVEVANLATGITYFGRITMTDLSGNQGQSAEFTFSLAPPTGKPLVLIYAVLDNNLGDDTEQLQRLIRNVELGAANEKITVRLLIDWPGANNAYSYELTGGTSCITDSPTDPTCGGRYVENTNFWRENEDTAHPQALHDFVQKALTAHNDAAKIVLSLVGHGSGWTANALPSQPSSWSEQPSRSGPNQERIGGLLWDDTIADDSSDTHALSTKALGIALDWLNNATGRKIDLLYLDACSMGMAEVADEVAPYVDYLLVSPNTAWASFAYDEMLAATSSNMDGEAIGKAWLNAEKQALEGRGSGYPYTLALYHLTQMDTLATAVSSLATALGNAATSQRSAINSAIDVAERYESNYDGKINSADHYADLGSFLQGLESEVPADQPLTTAIGAVRNAIGLTVVEFAFVNGTPYLYPDQLWAWHNAKGVGIYLPRVNDAKRPLYISDNLRWVQRSGWDQFLDKLGVVAADASSAELPTCASTRSCSVKLAAPLRVKTGVEIYLPIVQR